MQRWRQHPERGGTTVEYVAVGALVAALVASVVAVVPGVSASVTGGLSTLVCRVAGGGGCGGLVAAPAVAQEAAPDAPDPLAGGDGDEQEPDDGGGDGGGDGAADEDGQDQGPGDGDGGGGGGEDDDGGFLDGVGDLVGEVIGDVAGGVGGFIGDVAAGIGRFLGGVGSFIGDVAAGIGRLIGAVGSFIGDVAATVGDVVSGLGDLFDGKEEVPGTPVPVPPEEFVRYALEHPDRIVDYTTTPAEFIEHIGGVPDGWRVTTLGQGGHAGQGWKLEEVDANGNLTGRQIRWHPGGGRHGPDPYWTFTSGEHGKKQIVNPDTWVP